MPKAKPRFQIQVVYPNGSYMRFESHREKEYTPAEIIEQLRRCADLIEVGLKKPDAERG